MKKNQINYTFFGIRNKKTGKPMGFSIFSNEGGEFCNSCGATLQDNNFDTYPIWLVDSREQAEKTLAEDPDWYNASVEWPQWPKKDWNTEDFEVYVATLTIP